MKIQQQEVDYVEVIHQRLLLKINNSKANSIMSLGGRPVVFII